VRVASLLRTSAATQTAHAAWELTPASLVGTGGYRDPFPFPRERLADLLVDRARQLPLARLVAHVVAARAGRATFGAVGIAGAAAMVGCALAGLRGGELGAVLLGTWAAALVAWAVARVAFGIVASRAGGPPRLTGDLHHDIARIAGAKPPRAGHGLEISAAVLPMVAVSLLAPLTIHLAFWSFFLREPFDSMRTFDTWIVISFAIVGHCHCVLAYLAGRYGARLVGDPLVGLPLLERGWTSLGLVVLASCVPGIALIGIPPALTALTGAAFIPALYATMRRIITNERRALESTEEALRVARLLAG
jgi:hypothetical protein